MAKFEVKALLLTFCIMLLASQMLRPAAADGGLAKNDQAQKYLKDMERIWATLARPRYVTNIYGVFFYYKMFYFFL